MAYTLQIHRPLTYVDPHADLDEMINLLIDVSTTQQFEAPLTDLQREFIDSFATDAIELRQQLEDAIFHGLPRRQLEKLTQRIRRCVVASLECFVNKYAN